ncbi:MULTISPECIES: YicC/YloC family endoribonuclease [Lysinibacillus]|uniref:YicC family protein n=2 Tax=Lysinibacillus capsici TaxID=2115968 RepID=A0ABY8KEP2_9BACI|nr:MULTISPECIES: YicC/YloC family endoribonuclease [Lysinibacillus]OCX61408.1 YicC family protein [Lysinibacillus sp. AR18-8]RDV34181.1 YicC family protein [Lysinibacillus capsici]WGF37960.1 YicC family protein [Lysinibacillus capsici]WPK06384.1 YicC/YloC family endoribonuclease [Lysinibacillus capsici]
MVRSMTGFGRGVTTTRDFQLTVEMRSVNHRFLEINAKFPKEWLEAEIFAKKLISQALSRGKIDVMVYVKDLENVEQSIEINWSLIEAYRKAKEQLASKVPLEEKWTMQELLSLEQALVQQKPQLTPEDLLSAVEQAISQAISQLVQMREREGQELQEVVVQYKEQLMEQVNQIRLCSSLAVEKYRTRLIERINEVADGTLLEDRLLAEVAIFAERVDISEELDRLDSHFNQLEETLLEKISVGRKLDFLMQEIHREINTIGSKNQSTEAAIAVVQAKTILEKMREQVQNIE